MIYITFNLKIKQAFSIFFDNNKWNVPHPNCYFDVDFESHNILIPSESEERVINFFKLSEHSMLFFNELDTIEDRDSEKKNGTLRVEFIKNDSLWYNKFTFIPNNTTFLERMGPYLALLKRNHLYCVLIIQLSTESALKLIKEFNSDSDNPKLDINNFEIRFHESP